MFLCVVAIGGAMKGETIVEADGSIQLAEASDEAAGGEGADWPNAKSSVTELPKAVAPLWDAAALAQVAEESASDQEGEFEGASDAVTPPSDTAGLVQLHEEDNITNASPKALSLSKQCAGNPILLGTGMYGSVYKMKCPKKSTFAVKVFKSTIAFIKNRMSRFPKEVMKSFGDEDDDEINEDAETAFEREVRVQKKAAELGLAPEVYSHEIFRAGEAAVDKALQLVPNVIYGSIFMAIAPGKSLKQVLDGVEHADPAVWMVLNKIATAIKALHHAGLFHGDLSFDNVYIDGDKVTLIDFGKAQETKQETEGVFEIHCKVFFKVIDESLNEIKANAPEHSKCAQLAKGETV